MMSPQLREVTLQLQGTWLVRTLSDSKALAFYSPGVTGSTVPNSQVGSGRETVAEHITKCNYHWPQLWDPDGSGGDCCKPLACALGTGRLLLGSP